jgi:DNA-binding helix-hairpin-helix protein with protein kinase domain
MQVIDIKGKTVQLGSSVGQGGEATVYRVNSRAGQLAKIYEPAPRTNYPHKLAWMLAHPPANPTRASHHPSLAWPTGLLYDGQQKLVGYLMPHIQGAIPVLMCSTGGGEICRPTGASLHRAARSLAAILACTSGCSGDLNETIFW